MSIKTITVQLPQRNFSVTLNSQITVVEAQQQRIIENAVVVQGLKGDKGDKGDNGSSIVIGDFVALESIKKGQLVYVSRSNGQIGIADAAVYQKSFIAGFAIDDVNAGFVVSVGADHLTLNDWSTFADTALLAVGCVYFLNVGGGLTLTPPSKPEFVSSAIVGKAVTMQTLIVTANNPLML